MWSLLMVNLGAVVTGDWRHLLRSTPLQLSPTGRSEALAPGKPVMRYRNPS
jgi:hypothetical protein